MVRFPRQLSSCAENYRRNSRTRSVRILYGRISRVPGIGAWLGGLL